MSARPRGRGAPDPTAPLGDDDPEPNHDDRALLEELDATLAECLVHVVDTTPPDVADAHSVLDTLRHLRIAQSYAAKLLTRAERRRGEWRRSSRKTV
jgi:hypothetical protein